MAQSKTSIMKRRRVRELEAKRDKLLELQAKSRADLTTVRAQLAHERKQPAR